MKCYYCGEKLQPGIGEEADQWRTAPGGKYFCLESPDGLHHVTPKP